MLNDNQFTGDIPTQIESITKLAFWNLNSNGIQGSIPESICSLTELEFLTLSDNLGLTGTLPDCLGNLTKMESFSAYKTSIGGSLPESLCNWDSIVYFALFTSQFSGTLPNCSFGADTLTYFLIYENSFSGTIPSSLCLNHQMVVLDMSFNDFQSSMPYCLGSNMTELSGFYVNDNMLTGTYNGALLCETKMFIFGISNNNHMTGTIPTCINNIKDTIGYILFYNNSFSGSLPETICELNNLIWLGLDRNEFTGTLPSCMGDMSSFDSFWFYSNQFTGTIPNSICDASRLALFDGFINQMSGTIPSCLLYNLPRMYLLYLDRNNFTGPFFSNSTCSLISTRMRFITINGNDLTGTLPACLNTQFPSLLRLSVYDNKRITGPIPQSLCNLTTLNVFAASNMGLTGPLPTCWKSTSALRQLFLGENQLTGTIPDSLCKLKRLQYLSLSYNEFEGDIPSCFGTASLPLVYLNLSENSLTGSLPETLCHLNKTLAYLSADKNKLQGSVASCFGSMTVLQRMILSYNQLTGDMRCFSSHDGLPMLQELGITHNKFTGSLFEDIAAFSSLVRPLTTILVENNQFSGPLPSSNMVNASNTFGAVQTVNIIENHFYGKLDSALFQVAPLINLALVKNCLSGSIPDTICNVVTLELLSLDGLSAGCKPNQRRSGREKVYGSIPECIFAMSAMHTLHLAANNLKGSLPDGIGYYTKNLTDLSLSHNQLQGSIPDVIQKRNWTNLDLAFNKFNNVLLDSDETTMWNVENRAVSLIRNRLSGHIPKQFLDAEEINILEGNLFSCNIQASNLPEQDPYAERYSCGTNTVNIMLFIGVGLIAFSLIAMFLWINSDTWYPIDQRQEAKNMEEQGQEQGLSMINLPTQHNDEVESFAQQHGDGEENDDSKSESPESAARGALGSVSPSSEPQSGSIQDHSSSETTVVVQSSSSNRQQVPAISLSGSTSTRGVDDRHGSSSRHPRHNSSNSEETTSERRQQNGSGSGSGSGNNSARSRVNTAAGLKDRVGSTVQLIMTDVGLSSSPLTGRSNKNISNHGSGSGSDSGSGRAGSGDHYQQPGSFSPSPQPSHQGDVMGQQLQLQQSHRSTTPPNSEMMDMQLQLGPGKLSTFLRSCDQQRRLLLGSGLISIVIFLPVYVTLGNFFRTHSQVYAWAVSAAFTSGIIPAVTLLCLWVTLLLFLYQMIDPFQRYRGSGSTMRFAWQRLYQMKAFWQEYTCIALVLFLNACFLLALNGAYVYLTLRYGRAASTALQIVLAMFKIIYNSRFVSRLVKGSESLQSAAAKMKREKRQELQQRQRLEREELATAARRAIAAVEGNNAGAMVDAGNVEETRAVEEPELDDDGLIPGISSEAALIIFNFIIVPIIATACVDSNCFYTAIVPPPPLQTVFPIELCASDYSFDSLINAVRFSACPTVVDSSITTSFEPPFSYSGQCASSVIAAYVPVFVLMFLVNLFVFPLPRLFGKCFCTKPAAAAAVDPKNPAKLPEVLDSIGFDRRGFTIARVTNFSVLLTFGWVYPPLAVLIAMVEIRDVAYVAATLRRYIQQVGDVHAVEKELGRHVRSVAQSVSYLQLRCLPFGAICLALVLYDMVGDTSGYSRGVWALILMALMPWVLDQLFIHTVCRDESRRRYGNSHPTDAIHAAAVVNIENNNRLKMSVPVDIEEGGDHHYHPNNTEHNAVNLYEPVIRSDDNVADEDSGYQSGDFPSSNTIGSGGGGPRLIFTTNEYDLISIE